MRPTIKDIAKATGVSHGTVSNVLNKRGNVSVEKIKLVEQAALAMGYELNNKAKSLRQGTTRSLAFILPTLDHPGYVDLYTSARQYATEHEYSTHLFLTQDMPAQEMDVLKELISLRVNGIIAISCLEDAYSYYNQPGLADIKKMFLIRRGHRKAPFAGFDDRQAGHEIGRYITATDMKRIAVFTDDSRYSNCKGFISGIQEALTDHDGMKLQYIDSRLNRINAAAYELFQSGHDPELIVLSSESMHHAVMSAWRLGSQSSEPQIVSLSALRLCPHQGTIPYYLNYKRLGLQSCTRLIQQLEQKKTETGDLLIRPNGFPQAAPEYPSFTDVKQLNALFLDCPSTTALKKITPSFTKQTGIKINYHVFPLSEIYDIIDTVAASGIYDVIRMDMAWLSWFAERTLLPLSAAHPDPEQIYSRFLPQLRDKYCSVNGTLYALPFDPSVQMMFYRKDLFEDAFYRRAFYEKTRTHLQVPTTFDEYNHVVRFFTKQYNHDSPTEFGATVALGYPTSIACEFLTRLLCYDGIHDDQGRIDFTSPSAIAALDSYLETTRYANLPESEWWKSVVDNFSSGKAATTIVYTNHAADIIHAQDSAVAGKIGYATVPGGKPILGGGVIGIAAKSAHTAEAGAFIDWACSESIAAEITMLGGMSPCSSVYDHPEINQLYPWVQHVPTNISLGERKKILSLSEEVINQRTFEHALGIAIKNVITGAFNSAEAMNYAADMLDRCFADNRHRQPGTHHEVT